MNTETNNRWNHKRSWPVTELVERMIADGDPYTVGHQRRVASLAQAIAERMELTREEVDSVYLAASVHDLGKNKIDSVILSKPGTLTDAERAVIQTHSLRGYRILEGLFSWPIAGIVLQHHERLDGSGYPGGASEGILLEARVLAIADVVEAMTSLRPYRMPLGVPAALAEITQGAGTRYDARTVDACVEVYDHGWDFEDEA